jgi:hypothetical protein
MATFQGWHHGVDQLPGRPVQDVNGLPDPFISIWPSRRKKGHLVSDDFLYGTNAKGPKFTQTSAQSYCEVVVSLLRSLSFS